MIVFLNTDGEGILNATQRNAFERWTQRGGGIVGIHADANADRDWAWKGDMMGGAWFLNHPSGAVQFQQATVNVVDTEHPSTKNFRRPTGCVRTSGTTSPPSPQGKVHVLMKLDESTYESRRHPAADDHPIAWCSNYDGGRHFYTALGHSARTGRRAPTRRTSSARSSGRRATPQATGTEREGIPTEASFDKVTLDDTTENPMEIAVAATVASTTSSWPGGSSASTPPRTRSARSA